MVQSNGDDSILNPLARSKEQRVVSDGMLPGAVENRSRRKLHIKPGVGPLLPRCALASASFCGTVIYHVAVAGVRVLAAVCAAACGPVHSDSGASPKNEGRDLELERDCPPPPLPAPAEDMNTPHTPPGEGPRKEAVAAPCRENDSRTPREAAAETPRREHGSHMTRDVAAEETHRERRVLMNWLAFGASPVPPVAVPAMKESAAATTSHPKILPRGCDADLALEKMAAEKQLHDGVSVDSIMAKWSKTKSVRKRPGPESALLEQLMEQQRVQQKMIQHLAEQHKVLPQQLQAHQAYLQEQLSEAHMSWREHLGATLAEHREAVPHQLRQQLEVTQQQLAEYADLQKQLTEQLAQRASSPRSVRCLDEMSSSERAEHVVRDVSLQQPVREPVQESEPRCHGAEPLAEASSPHNVRCLDETPSPERAEHVVRDVSLQQPVQESEPRWHGAEILVEEASSPHNVRCFDETSSPERAEHVVRDVSLQQPVQESEPRWHGAEILVEEDSAPLQSMDLLENGVSIIVSPPAERGDEGGKARLSPPGTRMSSKPVVQELAEASMRSLRLSMKELEATMTRNDEAQAALGTPRRPHFEPPLVHRHLQPPLDAMPLSPGGFHSRLRLSPGPSSQRSTPTHDSSLSPADAAAKHQIASSAPPRKPGQAASDSLESVLMRSSLASWGTELVWDKITTASAGAPSSPEEMGNPTWVDGVQTHGQTASGHADSETTPAELESSEAGLPPWCGTKINATNSIEALRGRQIVTNAIHDFVSTRRSDMSPDSGMPSAPVPRTSPSVRRAPYARRGEAELPPMGGPSQFVSVTSGKYSLTAGETKRRGSYAWQEQSSALVDEDSGEVVGYFSCDAVSHSPLLLNFTSAAKMELPCIRIVDSEVMAEIQNSDNAGACFVLPSQLNGAEYPGDGHVVKGIEEYRFDGTGGPRGQLAVHPAVGQFMLDNAACDGNPNGINAVDRVLEHCKALGFAMVNGYLKVPNVTDPIQKYKALQTFRRQIHWLRPLVMEGVPACGLKPDHKSFSQASHKVTLVYASAVPVQAYLNESGDQDFQVGVAEAVLIAQYYGALRTAARSATGGRRRVFLMPLGGGVFNIPLESIAKGMSLAVELLSCQEREKLDIAALTWKGNPREGTSFKELLSERGKLAGPGRRFSAGDGVYEDEPSDAFAATRTCPAHT